MEALVFVSIWFFVTLSFDWALCPLASERQLKEHARRPPRGWNSYDSFSWTISEEEFLQNSEIVKKKLRVHGYEYVVVDYLWYRRKVDGAYTDSLGYDVIDEWGRVIPDPGRWPSSGAGKGFTEVAERVHGMGLKFGIHVMRGISTQAVNANTPILDTLKGRAYEEFGKQWRAKDIGLADRTCAWMPHGFMSVNTSSGAGRAFLRSLYEQYASWGVDFVKLDCVFGDDFVPDEIRVVSKVIEELDHPILYSLSPGTGVTPAMAKEVSGLVNMYRITGDDWDSWHDVASHFDITRAFSDAKMIGARGLLGKSWPDLDMLPLGWLTDAGSNLGPHRMSKLSLDEQRTQMTLWAMAKSPLMFGGDLRKLDKTTYNIITNPTILELNHFSSGNKEFPYISSRKSPEDKTWDLGKNLRNQVNVSSMGTRVLGLSSCKPYQKKGWVTEDLGKNLERVCWKDSVGSENRAPYCLYRQKQPPALYDGEISKEQYQGKMHLSPNTTGFCLDASPRRKLSSEEFKGGSFSPCRQDVNQLWELKLDGILMNNYSGLCATINTVKANVYPTGVRAWVAHGRRGKMYVGFFNLGLEKVVISAKVSELLGKEGSCNCTEAWSGRHVSIRRGLLSMAVRGHGCALFGLTC